MRFGFIGAGAMGSAFGAHLTAAGNDVVLYDNDSRIIDRIQGNGLRVKRPTGDDLIVELPASANASTFRPVDVAFVFVKSPDTVQAVDNADPMLDASTKVVTLQNGLGNYDVLCDLVGSPRVLGGYTTVGANTISLGHVHVLGTGKTIVGGGDDATAMDVATALTDAGLPTEAVVDPMPYIWDKQFVNVGIKPVAALTELRNGPIAEYDPTRSAVRALVEEAVAVAQAKDVEVLTSDPVKRTIDILASKYNKKSSILEDVERERPTEIEAINGAIVKQGASVGVPTPYNEIVTNLVNGKERSYLDVSETNSSQSP